MTEIHTNMACFRLTGGFNQYSSSKKTSSVTEVTLCIPANCDHVYHLYLYGIEEREREEKCTCLYDHQNDNK